MQTYKITKGNWSQLKNFDSLAAAELFYLGKVEQPYNVELASAGDQIPVKTAKQILNERQAFGATLQQTFVLDNAPFAPTKAQAKQLLAKLRDAWELAELGSLQLCSEELTDVATDTIFTAERKAKYLLMISNYLASE